jgi:hypothetical protein
LPFARRHESAVDTCLPVIPQQRVDRVMLRASPRYELAVDSADASTMAENVMTWIALLVGAALRGNGAYARDTLAR